MRIRRTMGGAAAVPVLSVALILVPAGVASAHEEHDVGPYSVAGGFGIPGDYRAFFVPTRPGDYTFHFTGTIKGTPVNESFTSGPKTFSSVDDPSSVEFPVKDPTTGELGDAVQRLQPRVDGAVAAQQRLTAENRTLRDDVDSAKSLATVALIVGGALGLIGIGVGLAGLAAARRARRVALAPAAATAATRE